MTDYDHLYDVSIDVLGLTEEAKNAMYEGGVTTIGDCLDFYIRGADALIQIRAPFGNVISGEVQEKIKQQGYWQYVGKS